MFSSRQKLPRTLQGSSRIALVVALAAVLGACAGSRPEVTGSINSPGSALSEGDQRHQMQALAARYQGKPDDPEAAIAYAQALRAGGQRAQAAAVLQQASIRNPKHLPLLGAYGRALADVGRLNEALDVLGKAHTPDRPDWRILNAQGAVLDQMGRHAEAQRYYKTALKMAPNEPSVLSNLGLSYALSNKLDQAETTLRQAAADPRAAPKVQQNLAVVLSLRSKFEEAEKIGSSVLPPEQARANVAYVREMMREPARGRDSGPRKTASAS